jgi:hypothetical protein
MITLIHDTFTIKNTHYLMQIYSTILARIGKKSMQIVWWEMENDTQYVIKSKPLLRLPTELSMM